MHATKRWRRLGIVGGLIAGVLALAGTANAQSGVVSHGGGSQGGAGADGPTVSELGFEVRIENNRPVIYDTIRDFTLLNRNGPDVVQTNISSTIKPTVQYEISDCGNGYDMILTAHNNTPTSRPIASICISTMILGQYVDVRDMRWGARSRVMNGLTNNPEILSYPGDLYAPVHVLGGQHYTIGVSVKYPILEYKHDVAFHPNAPAWLNNGASPSERRWNMYIHFSRPYPTSGFMFYDAMLEPGETREYVVAVRVQRNTGQWIRTIEPYSRYFHDMYGPVKYQRDPRHVKARVFAGGFAQGPDNPAGWYPNHRIDQNGWQYSVNTLITGDPYERIMLWAPSGLYDSGVNFPFQFTSRLKDSPQLETAFDPAIGLPRVAAAGKQLGLWWGNSARYAATWNPEEQPVLDIENPVHRTAAFHELDLAYEAGVRAIGLDAMSHKRIPMWKQIQWIGELQERAPGVKFVVEPATCDVLHNITPMYFRGYGAAAVIRLPPDLTNIRSPHYLADLLNPGHETWASMRWDPNARAGRTATAMDRFRDTQRAAFYGFVPILFDDVNPAGLILARRSWLATVPEDMRIQSTTVAAGSQ